MKNEALVRDVARLFLKYDLEDWRSFLGMLRESGPDYDLICGAIEEIASKRGKQSREVKTKTSSAANRLPKDIDDTRALLLSKVQNEISSKSDQWSLGELRNVYLRSGGKDPLPAKKRDAIRAFILRLARLPNDVFSKSVQGILDRNTNLQEEYSKWFQMIYGPAGNADSRVEHSELKFSQVNTAITEQLEDRIKQAISSNRFRLVYNPLTGASKEMTFLADGTIGEGRNSNEFTWRIVDGRLELIEQSGTTYSRFILTPDGAFHHTNDLDTQSIRDQRLLPIGPLNNRTE